MGVLKAKVAPGVWEEVPGSSSGGEGGRLLGEIIPYGLPTGTPPGWLECDGHALDSAEQTAYPDLAAGLGTTYNRSGDAPTVIRLPDLRRRFLRGTGTTGAVIGSDDAHESDETARTVTHKHGTNATTTGNTGVGHDHAISQVGHQIVSNTATGGTSARVYQIGGSGDSNHSHGGSTGSASPSTSHNHSVSGGTDNSTNSDFPYLTVRYLIRAVM